MHLWLLPCLLLCSSALHLRSQQIANSRDNVDLLQPLELLVQLFGQAFDTTTQALETQLLQRLYPDTYTQIQGELDDCEEQFWDSQATALQNANTQLMKFADSCGSADPTVVVNQLVQDTLASMLSATCQDVSVDLVGDSLRLLANSLDFQSSQPQEVNSLYLQPLVQAAGDLAQSQGISRSAINQTNVDTEAFIDALNEVLDSLATSGGPTKEELAALIRAQQTLFTDYSAEYSEIIREASQYISQAVRVTCAFAAPAISLLR